MNTLSHTGTATKTESSRDANIPATSHNPNDHQCPIFDPRLEVKECCSGSQTLIEDIPFFAKESPEQIPINNIMPDVAAFDIDFTKLLGDQKQKEIEAELEKKHAEDLQNIRFDMYTLEELRKTNFSNDPLFDPFLPRTGVAAVVGMPDSGKSMLCRQLALSLVHGKRDFLGFPLKPKHRRAIFVTTEDTIEATRACFIRQSDAMNSEGKPMQEKDLVIILGDDMTTDEILDRLELMLSRLPFDLVIIDAFGDIFKGGEGNSNIANRNSLRPFSILAKKHGTCVLFVHHTNKGARHAVPDHIHVQGGSGFVQKVRSVLELRSKKDNGGIKYLVCTKGNGVSHKTKSQAVELLFDEKTFIYKYSGMKIPVEDLRTDKNEVSVKIKIDAKEIFAPHEMTLKRNEIISRAIEKYDVSRSTVERWISDTLEVLAYGTYKNPDFILTASQLLPHKIPT